MQPFMEAIRVELERNREEGSLYQELSSKIYGMKVPQETEPPYLWYLSPGPSPDDRCFDGRIERLDIQVNLVAASFSEAARLGVMVEAILDGSKLMFPSTPELVSVECLRSGTSWILEVDKLWQWTQVFRVTAFRSRV